MIDKAREFAIRCHGEQQYGAFPYSVHLDQVAKYASQYGDTATVVAYLHDVVEDTDTTLDEIEMEFGSLVSKCVGILTDEPGQNRQERKRKTYEKMSKVSGELELALIVKAADRLANIRACTDHENNELLTMYESEHSIFRKAAYRSGLCEKLWQEMEALLDS
ncbi:hypothetical protein BTA51_27660 [Hahella sp. CCB-MM4]|uniref:HD domain-containing protein n=1 Tax=Hahella sp. (strain CCB-MM4) TaxID=1926491 RepID=UPI000B9AAC04|nr:HD domain-containing protein [Hahella sp. CCB-MM4]OZG70149.1 hypothetical protein BTA51_27660 [Hahella sp. CCB-MM4]